MGKWEGGVGVLRFNEELGDITNVVSRLAIGKMNVLLQVDVEAQTKLFYQVDSKLS